MYKFSSIYQAIQHLSDYTGKRVIIADVSDLVRNFKLYHVTDRSNLESIKQHGLKPKYNDVVFLSFKGRNKEYPPMAWAAALNDRIKDPIVLEFDPKDVFPFYMRDFSYKTQQEVHGRGDDQEKLIWPEWEKSDAGDLVKIRSMDDLKTWLEVLEAHGEKDFDPLDYELMEVMVKRNLDISKAKIYPLQAGIEENIKFSSIYQAIQHLSDYTGKRVIIAVENWYSDLPESDKMLDMLWAIYELEYKYNRIKGFPNKWTGMPQRRDNILDKMEKKLKDIAADIADMLIEVFDNWLAKHALLDADKWAKSRVKELEEIGEEDDMLLYVKDEFQRYSKADFESAMAEVIGRGVKESKSLNQFLKEWGQEYKNFEIDERSDDEDFDESSLDFLDDPEEVMQYMLDNFGEQEILATLPDYVKDDLGFVLYKYLVFPIWIKHWEKQGIDKTRVRVEETRDILENISNKSVSIGEVTSRLNHALNEAHQTGDMMDYISGQHEISHADLDELSDMDVSEWNEELEKIGLEL